MFCMHETRARLGVCCALLSLTLMGSAVALEVPPPPRDMAQLSAALRASWLQHPAAEATEFSLVAARARADAASQPLYNPEIEADYDDEGSERSASVGVGISIDAFGKGRARAAVGEADLSLVQAQAWQRRTAFAQQWLSAWVDRRTASTKIQLGEEHVALVERFGELAQLQFSVGDISALERDLALLARDEAQAQLANLRAEASVAEESFRAVGGDRATLATDALSRMPPPIALDPGWRADSLGEGRIAAATMTSASARVSVALRDQRADPSVSLRAGRIDRGSFTDNAVGVSLSVPLYMRNGFRAEVEAAHADADLAAAEARRINLETSARAERAIATYSAMRTAWEQWSQSPGTEVAKRADLLERLWRAGEISTSDYLVQIKQSLDTALAGADLQARLWSSYFEALIVSGGLDAWIGFDPISPKANL